MAGYLDLELIEEVEFHQTLPRLKKIILDSIHKYSCIPTLKRIDWETKKSNKFKIGDIWVRQLPQKYVDNPGPRDKAYLIDDVDDLLPNSLHSSSIEVHIRENGENDYFAVL